MRRTPIPRPKIDPGAVAHDQQRDEPGGIERGRGRSHRGMRLPHERDEAPRPDHDRDVEPQGSTERVEQAARDIERGLVDTDRRGTPSDLPRSRGSRRRQSR